MTCHCQIQWIDETGKPTPDSNEAIGYCYREAYRHVHSMYPLGYADFERTRNYGICAEHLEQFRQERLDREHWVFVPYQTA